MSTLLFILFVTGQTQTLEFSNYDRCMAARAQILAAQGVPKGYNPSNIRSATCSAK